MFTARRHNPGERRNLHACKQGAGVALASSAIGTPPHPFCLNPPPLQSAVRRRLSAHTGMKNMTVLIATALAISRLNVGPKDFLHTFSWWRSIEAPHETETASAIIARRPK